MPYKAQQFSRQRHCLSGEHWEVNVSLNPDDAHSSTYPPGVCRIRPYNKEYEQARQRGAD